MSMTHRQRSLTKADGRAVRKRRCGSVDVEGSVLSILQLEAMNLA